MGIANVTCIGIVALVIFHLALSPMKCKPSCTMSMDKLLKGVYRFFFRTS